jgi:hypothetical protein
MTGDKWQGKQNSVRVTGWGVSGVTELVNDVLMHWEVEQVILELPKMFCKGLFKVVKHIQCSSLGLVV